MQAYAKHMKKYASRMHINAKIYMHYVYSNMSKYANYMLQI